MFVRLVSLLLTLLVLSVWLDWGKHTEQYSYGDDSTLSNCGTFSKQHMYDVLVLERDAAGSDGGSLISRVNDTSDFQYNFAAAWFSSNKNSSTGQDNDEEDGLVVRLVDWTLHPEWVNAGSLAVVPARLPLTAQHIDESMITWAGATESPSLQTPWGAADPRIVSHNGTYFLTWDNCTKNCWPTRKTMLSTSQNPWDPHSWTLHGDVFPLGYSGGASLLFRDDGQSHLAFVGNSNTADKVFVVESRDGIHWDESSKQMFMEGRPGCWDSAGVAAGPQPERLSTGDYLYVYNIDTGWPYHPNPLGRCSIGWAVLDGMDPTQIVARSDKALIKPELPWETCSEGRTREDCQVPMVVFSTGLKPIGNDEFYILYGGADASVGITKIAVNVATGTVEGQRY